VNKTTAFNKDNPINVLIADDHEVVRVGIKRLLSVEKIINVLDESPNGADLIEKVNHYRPDVVLTDIMMPQMTGIEATQIIKSKSPGTIVIMLTAYEDSFHLEKAIAAGADGYLAKDVGAKELIESIFKAVEGERVFSQSILRLMQKQYIPEDDYSSKPIFISKREQQILNHLVMGKKNQDIADSLNISIRTVESHRFNIMKKFGVNNIASLVRFAVMYEHQAE